MGIGCVVGFHCGFSDNFMLNFLCNYGRMLTKFLQIRNSLYKNVFIEGVKKTSNDSRRTLLSLFSMFAENGKPQLFNKKRHTI